jgi:hypothetical protein
MNLLIDYLGVSHSAKLTSDEDGRDWRQLLGTVREVAPEMVVDGLTVTLSWRSFLACRVAISQFKRYHDCGVRLTTDAEAMLKHEMPQSYASAIKNAKTLGADEIKRRLANVGFLRDLTDNQLANVGRIVNLPSAATFSVPGAGKTTEALAYFFLNASEDDRLLVVAPVNAFGAWDEQLQDCVGIPPERGFVRLRGQSVIAGMLRKHPRFMIMTYSQLPYSKEDIVHELDRGDVFMFLDESHRIKGGRGKTWADAVLDVSYLPAHKLIMTGTPMPQSTKDLVPQFTFLFPDKPVNDETVVAAIQPIFVRTTQGELGIPSVDRKIVSVEMGKAQEAVYRTLRSEASRELASLSKTSKLTLRSIGKCSIRLLEFVSNPALLTTSLKYAFDPSVGELLLRGDGPKIEYACWRARELAKEGKKVIIWSSFVQNVELISSRLGDLGADFIHGGVGAGDEDDDGTREGKIKLFHDDPDRMVLVANPAACAEGISLHKVCQYAIYVDRSFNAAQYLQSEDRIHRLGLKPGQRPVVEILQCPKTIDEVVNHRLTDKVRKMADVLNDKSLSISAELYDSEFESDEEISDEDAAAILSYFFPGGMP